MLRLGLNNSEIQKANRCLILKLMLEKESITRIELSKCTGLRKATITNIINEFLNMGIIVESNTAQTENNKRGELLSLNLSGMYILSIGINRKNYKIYLYTLNGKLECKIEKALSMEEDINKTMDMIKDSIREVLVQFGEENILGMCLGMPGPYIKNTRDVAIVTGFDQLSKLDARKELEDAFHIPILSEHDAKLSAFAEWKNSDEAKENKKVSLVAFRSVGVGIGAGIVINGRVIEGQLGIAGEIGHMGINYNEKRSQAGHAGFFELHAGTEVARFYVQERLYEFPQSVLTEKSSYQDIINAYRQGDPLATWAMEKQAWMLGYGIANVIYMLNPDLIILGLDYPSYQLFIDKVNESVSEFVHPLILESVSIRASRLTEDSIMLGGYYFVLEKLLQNNTLLDCIKVIRERKAN